MASKLDNIRRAIEAIDAKIDKLIHRRGQLADQTLLLAEGETGNMAGIHETPVSKCEVTLDQGRCGGLICTDEPKADSEIQWVYDTMCAFLSGVDDVDGLFDLVPDNLVSGLDDAQISQLRILLEKALLKSAG